MTGFGRAELQSPMGRIGVELSGVNSRFLELGIRLPRPLAALEPNVREYLTAAISRGKISVYVNLSETEDTWNGTLINKAALKAYLRQLKEIKSELKLAGEIELSDLLQLPEVTRAERPEPDLKSAWPHLQKALDKALKAMLAMRLREGRALAADMKRRLKDMSDLVGEIEQASKGSVATYRAKLAARIQELLGSVNHDPVRLEEEIAYFAERTDIAEECTRFKSHVQQFLQALKQPEAAGRRLNFILQEMNREANTIGAKVADFEIAAAVISLKEEIEKIREQVQNVE